MGYSPDTDLITIENQYIFNLVLPRHFAIYMKQTRDIMPEEFSLFQLAHCATKFFVAFLFLGQARLFSP